GAAVLGVEDPSFTYGYYLDRLVVTIKDQWVRPRLGSGIEAVVHFRIEKDGSIRDVRVSRSSGYNSFDLAALRAVHSAAPFPPLPRSYPKRSLGVNLIFR
ncbi:MAG: energy transducer TonB, partial [Thermoanaerobaculia bacterium]|nr:energy transducer TonB [Thermoanaerobaculia bacterium]